MTDKRKTKLMDKLRKALDLEPIPDPPDPLWELIPQTTISAQGGIVAPLPTHYSIGSASSLTPGEVDELREMLEWYRKTKKRSDSTNLLR